MKSQGLHFKLRVVDLVELLIKRQPRHALLVNLYLPLVEAVRLNQSRDKLEFYSRLVAVYDKLLKNKEYEYLLIFS